MSAKPGVNYPDLEPGDEFWNRVRVAGSCYKSLASATVIYCLSQTDSDGH